MRKTFIILVMLFTVLTTLTVRTYCVETQQGDCEYSNCSGDILQASSHSCPPGFDGDPCECEASDYTGILKCESMRAYVIHGYWVGNCRDGSFCTGNCPLGFCNYNKSNDFQLPGNISELDDYICGKERTGVLCGKCRANYSVNYHSYTYQCTRNELCDFGWLFYLISELTPLTIVFVLVMASNVNFTSGALNGFILFAQMQDALTVHGNGVNRIPTEQEFFTAFHRLIYRFFNFEFFSIERLSFCLWRNAAVLDAIAFKYITIAYGLVLVFICVLIMNNSRVKRFFTCLRPKTLRSTMIHGLTTFFVMCYSQCARVSIQILGPMYLYRKGPEYVDTVVFRSGQLHMFEGEHLKYAIPAIFFTGTLLLLPPLILVLYPLSYKILARCNLSETKPVNYISRYIPIQLLDSFQSCFKDEVRFFAGIYFLYRIVPMVTFNASRSLTEFYTLLELFLIIVLSLHAVVQPYKNRWHNVIDSLLFADLAIINGMSLYNYQKAVQGITSQLTVTAVIQQILIYLPLVCVTIACVVKIFKKLAKHCRNKTRSRSDGSKQLSEDDLPPLRSDTLTDSDLHGSNYFNMS